MIDGKRVIRENHACSLAVTGGSGLLSGSAISQMAAGGHVEIWEQAAGAMRALLTQLLVGGSERTRVVVDRGELGHLFKRSRDDIAWEVFSPRLKVCHLLEDAIDYLEAEMAEAVTASEEEGTESRCTCWFTTPGVDLDVVFQTLQRARNHRFIGLGFGPWLGGPTVYAFEVDLRSPVHSLFCELLLGTPTMTEEEAFRALTSCRI